MKLLLYVLQARTNICPELSEIDGGVREQLHHVGSNFGESRSNRRDSSYHSSPKFPAGGRRRSRVGFDFGALFSRFKIRKAGSRTARLSVHFLFGRAKRKWTQRSPQRKDKHPSECYPAGVFTSTHLHDHDYSRRPSMNLHLYTLLSLLIVYTELFSQRVTIHHIDIGQGDATLIRTSHGKTVLIDAGDTGKGKTIILPYLHSLGITSLDYLVASHYHSDHIGGIDKLIQGLSPDSVRTILDRGGTPPLPTSRAFRQYWSAAQSTNRHAAVYLGQTIKLTKEVFLQCLAVDGAVFRCGEVAGSRAHLPDGGLAGENNRSIAWLLSSEHTVDGRTFSFKYFTGGDCGGVTETYTDIETPLAAFVGDVDAMKINHHGSRYSTNRTFLDSLRPEAVVISVGDRNIYRHPAQETLHRLQSTTSVRYIYQTETGNGGITAKARILGTVTISVFDSFFTIGADTFRLQSRPACKSQLVSSIALTPEIAPAILVSASVEDGFLMLNLVEAMDVWVKLFNILGQEVDKQPKTHFLPGIHQIHLFDPTLPSGVYLVRIITPSGVLTKKAVLLK